MARAAVLATATTLPVTASAPAGLPRPCPVASHGPAAQQLWRSAGRVYDEVTARTRGLDGPGRLRVARTIVAEAARAGIDPLVVVAMIQVESSFDPRAVSSRGAVGLMQLLDSTLREVTVRSRLPSASPRDPAVNVQAGVRYFAGLVGAFSDVDLALMAYNAGPNRIRRYLRAGGVPDRFRAYPRKVLAEANRLRAPIAPDLGPGDTLLASAARGRPRLVLARTPPRLASAAGIAGAPLARVSAALQRTAPGARVDRARVALLGAPVLGPGPSSVRARLRRVPRAPRPATAPELALLAAAVPLPGAPPGSLRAVG
jgi:hypothetical protein